MNGQENNPIRNIPNIEDMMWKCPCCNQSRQDKYIRIMTYDVSSLNNMETGTMFINVKYCSDIIACRDKAFDREWVFNKFFPRNNEIEKSKD